MAYICASEKKKKKLLGIVSVCESCVVPGFLLFLLFVKITQNNSKNDQLELFVRACACACVRVCVWVRLTTITHTYIRHTARQGKQEARQCQTTGNTKASKAE